MTQSGCGSAITEPAITGPVITEPAISGPAITGPIDTGPIHAGQGGLGSRALTGLRGVMALAIVVHHLCLRLPDLPQAVLSVTNRLYLAVDLFFVLSGFVMALGYGHWFAGRQPLSEYLTFIGRRIARVWPLHAVLALVLVAQDWTDHTGHTWPRMIVTNLLLIQAWGFSQTINAPAWSVSAEMLAYVLFPLLSGFTLRRRPAVAWLTLGCAVLTLAVVVWSAPDRGGAQRGPLDLHQNWSLLPPLRCLAGFTIGMLTGRALRSAAWVRWAGQAVVAPAAAGMVVILLMAGAPDGLVYALFPVLITALYCGTGRLGQALAAAPWYWVGTLSYALYLVHMPVLDLAGRWSNGGHASFTLLFGALVLPLTMLAHWGVERPGQILLRQWSSRLLASRRALRAG